jgi:hypothetical protein
VFRAKISLSVLLVVLLLGAAGCSSSSANRPGSDLARALEQDDASATSRVFGATGADPAANAAISKLLTSLPDGSRVRLVSSKAAPEPGRSTVTYEITLPGGQPRQVAFVVIDTGNGNYLMLPADQAP